ncbi:MAG: hypothetical protein GEV05_28640 [Betaproteobacteria bacterium]|nr:hypothetical protein [Betaproteobacteria bacterium]
MPLTLSVTSAATIAGVSRDRLRTAIMQSAIEPAEDGEPARYELLSLAHGLKDEELRRTFLAIERTRVAVHFAELSTVLRARRDVPQELMAATAYAEGASMEWLPGAGDGFKLSAVLVGEIRRRARDVAPSLIAEWPSARIRARDPVSDRAGAAIGARRPPPAEPAPSARRRTAKSS